MTREEWLIVVALTFERFQLRGNHHLSILVITDVERNDADRVTGDQELISFDIVKSEGKDTIQLLQHLADARMYGIFSLIYQGGEIGIGTHLTIEREDDLTVGTGLKLVGIGEASTDILVIIDLTVYGKHLFLVGCEQRLATTLWVNDAQTLVCEDGRTSTIDSAPVWSAVADLLTHT